MLVCLFGATSSPSCCGFALGKIATDRASEVDPLVLNSILHSFYRYRRLFRVGRSPLGSGKGHKIAQKSPRRSRVLLDKNQSLSEEASKLARTANSLPKT